MCQLCKLSGISIVEVRQLSDDDLMCRTVQEGVNGLEHLAHLGAFSGMARHPGAPVPTCNLPTCALDSFDARTMECWREPAMLCSYIMLNPGLCGWSNERCPCMCVEAKAACIVDSTPSCQSASHRDTKAAYNAHQLGNQRIGRRCAVGWQRSQSGMWPSSQCSPSQPSQ